MHIVFRVLLIIIVFVIVVDCQGGGGGRSRSTRSSGSRGWRSRPYHGSSASTCKDGSCIRREAILTFKMISGIISIAAVIFFYYWWKHESMQSNETYVNSQTDQIEAQAFNPFESGFWSSRYHQYNAWHGPHRLMLLFDPETRKVTGNGSDDVGAYIIDGIYSIETNRIGLTKTYERGTGDPQQNLGHNVTIQMAWKLTERRFKGKWFVKTNKYTGEDEFELKLEKSERALQ